MTENVPDDGRQFLRNDLKNAKGASNLKFNEKIKAMQAAGRKIYHLGFGQSPFPVPQFAQEALKQHAWSNEYLPVAGLEKLRTSIVNLHRSQDGLHHFDKDDVLVGPGSKQLIYLLMCVISGDVIIVSPVWPTYKPQAELAGKRLFIIETTFQEKYKLTPQHIDELFQNNDIKEGSVLIFCNPNNPTGQLYTREELIDLSSTLRKHKLMVLSDEIYSKLTYADDFISISTFYPEGTILSSGISKWASCGGWRLGYNIFPKQLSSIRKVVHAASSQTHSSASSPVQHAAIELLTFDRRGEEFSKHCSRILHSVSKYCVKALRSVGVSVHESGAGYYIFPDFSVAREGLKKRGITTGEQMCDAMLQEADVALMASGAHGMTFNEEDMTTRLCYVNFDGTTALEKSMGIGLESELSEEFVKEYCSPTVEAIDRLASWITNNK